MVTKKKGRKWWQIIPKGEEETSVMVGGSDGEAQKAMVEPIGGSSKREGESSKEEGGELRERGFRTKECNVDWTYNKWTTINDKNFHR